MVLLNMKMNQIFKNGYSELSRAELSSLPCPFDITLIDDETMQRIVDNTEFIYQDRTKNTDISDDRKSEIWWEEMEEAVCAQGIKYIEDYGDYEFEEYGKRMELIEE
jgi:hypothetical protein